ncbi:MAG: hypothetical protein PHF60_01815 [Candidatus ainarchaeum sp.]|nr:hypothetical protein [Candidatus ainarchaeum sp.]
MELTELIARIQRWKDIHPIEPAETSEKDRDADKEKDQPAPAPPSISGDEPKGANPLAKDGEQVKADALTQRPVPGGKARRSRKRGTR